MTTAILLAAAICNAEVCPERQNDFCWENDKFGMRAYGPGEYNKWSGWDVFHKMPGAPGAAPKVERTARFRIGHVAPTTKPGVYDVYVSVGTRDGTPVYELPLPDSDGKKRYKIGQIELTRN